MRMESLAETLAPSIVRHAIHGHDGVLLRGGAVRIIDGRPVLAAVANQPGRPRQFTSTQQRAARQLQLDWRDVGAGVNSGAVDYLRSGGGSGDGGHKAMLSQIVTRERLDGAMAHLGPFAAAIARVILDCWPLDAWAASAGKTIQAAVAWVALALNRLAAYYWPRARDNRLTA